MKKISSIILLIMFVFAGYAQTNKMVTITGHITGNAGNADITLYSVANGNVVVHSKTKIAKDGNFGFYFTPDITGFYRIADEKHSVRIYVSPGKKINLNITDSTFTSLNPADKENKCLENWTKEMHTLKSYNTTSTNITYKTAFPLFPTFEKNKDAFLVKAKSGNASFDKLFKNMAQAEFEYEIFHFLFTRRAIQPTAADYPEIYSRFAQRIFNDASVLKYDFGMDFLGSIILYHATTLKQDGPEKKSLLDICLTTVTNDTVRGWLILGTGLTRAKAYNQEYRDQIAKVKKYLVTAEQQKVLDEHIRSIRTLNPGEDAINIEGTTVDGKKVALSDFKGKVVLIDVWATWCAPCKAEIPALQKLEEEMKDTDIVFISYSVDEIKGFHDIWAKYVVDKKLGGIQLSGEAGFKSAICTNYGINSIPRFMVFDKQGKIVTVNSPRPSNPELKELLKKLL